MAPVHPVNIILPLPITPSHEQHEQPRLRRRRSSTINRITNWAIAVQPGSPAPISPNKIPAHRRVSPSSSSFLHLIETPTSASKPYPSPRSPKDLSEANLTNWGYTSVFIHLPVTPSTPSHLRRKSPVTPVTPEIPMKSGKGLKKFKSMGILRRNRTKSNPGDVSPTTRTRARSRSRSGSVSPTKPTSSHKRSKSKARAKVHPPLPPALQTELMLMQFTGGGSLETNAQRLMEQRAKATSTKAVDAVYKDENGMMWLDEDERVEYEALLSPTSPTSPASPWIHFGSATALTPVSPVLGAIMNQEVEPVRRGSVKSLTPTERELEGAIAVRPTSPSAYIGVSLINTSVVSMAERSDRRRRRRPAPLKLNSSPAVPNASAAQGFDDSFEPSSVELVAMAAGMHIRAARAAVGRRGTASAARPTTPRVGSAPADVNDFNMVVVEMRDDNGRVRGKRMGFAKRAKALFGMD